MKLIAGRLNGTNEVRFWRTCLCLEDNFVLEIGNFAVAENKNGFDLIEIMGVVNTTEEYEKYFSGGNKVSKKIVAVIGKDFTWYQKGVEE